MLAEARLNALLNFLEEHEVGRISELAHQLGVSPMTIRRDLQKLEDQKHVRRIFGGVVLDRTTAGDAPLDTRRQEQSPEKMAIGQAAARLIQDGDTVILDAGSTTLCLAKHLHNGCNITLVTNFLPIMWELSGEPSIHLVALGGEFNHHQQYFHGPLAENALRQMRIDKLFLGIHGIQADHGLSENAFTDIPLKRLFLGISRQTIVLADSSKVGRAAFFRVCPASDVDLVITDPGADPAEVDRLKQAGLRVILA
jgi:DeoR/GlpR family transcriptional regulator of sugar metabolism